jgi:hypothetical protein
MHEPTNMMTTVIRRNRRKRYASRDWCCRAYVSGIFQKGPIQLNQPEGSGVDRSLLVVKQDPVIKWESNSLLAQSAKIGSRSIPSPMGFAQDQEDQDIDSSIKGGWCKCCEQA